MVRCISARETLPLRSAILRNGKPFEECVFPEDEQEGVFHLGFFVGTQLVSVATLFPDNYPERPGLGFRLRGMATGTAYRGSGCGTELIKFALSMLTSANASYIWCNARSSATAFYTKLGFEMLSEEFEISGIGPHFNMIRNLNT
ncbi:GNAT family N-acetyltransferase [Pedobacter sp. GR22-6]|uniref:GNAT family N-acetyltransferase n=1 Tax=Pedobacter sp. GR22-6 TaxID=3127957 RepID=UPI00307DB85D